MFQKYASANMNMVGMDNTTALWKELEAPLESYMTVWFAGWLAWLLAG